MYFNRKRTMIALLGLLALALFNGAISPLLGDASAPWSFISAMVYGYLSILWAAE